MSMRCTSPFYVIDPKFTVIWTTRHMEKRMSQKMVQDDATYKLNYFDFPVFVCGRSSMTGHFSMTHMALSSHKDSAAWVRIYVYVRNVIGGSPRY